MSSRPIKIIVQNDTYEKLQDVQKSEGPPWDAQYSFRSTIPHVAPISLLLTPGDMLSTKNLGYVYD